jgi:epoxyqueuosine reductase
MGNLVFGCDICQDVCPWNRKAAISKVGEFEPREGNRTPLLVELASLSREEFAARYRGSPIKRAGWKGLMRNVAVAMGNAGDPGLTPSLKQLLNCDEPVVRRHAAWAIFRIGAPDAALLLQSRLDREVDPETLETLSGLLRRLKYERRSSPSIPHQS